jgi:hypothetical protein
MKRRRGSTARESGELFALLIRQAGFSRSVIGVICITLTTLVTSWLRHLSKTLSRRCSAACGVRLSPLMRPRTQRCPTQKWPVLDAANDELERERAESVRVAYVAATRARDLLVVPRRRCADLGLARRTQLGGLPAGPREISSRSPNRLPTVRRGQRPRSRRPGEFTPPRSGATWRPPRKCRRTGGHMVGSGYPPA